MTSKKYQHGFTLLEVMIALVIFSIGLIGLAGLQAVSLQNNQVAYSRTMATFLAQDLADRIRNNKNKSDGSVPSYVHTTPATLGTAPTTCIGSAATCTQAQLAAFDLFEWDSALKDSRSTLLNAKGDVSLSSGVYTITIGWDEERKGVAFGSISCSSPPAGVACVKLVVTP